MLITCIITVIGKASEFHQKKQLLQHTVRTIRTETFYCQELRDKTRKGTSKNIGRQYRVYKLRLSFIG